VKVLEIKNLSLSFRTNHEVIQVLNNVSFSLEKGKTLGVVGESGSGKSLTAMSILRLLPKNAIVTDGEILFSDNDYNVDLLKLSEKELLKVRGNRISMIFQEPMTSLNPSMRCGLQVEEIILNHLDCDKKGAKKRVLDLFDEVKLPEPNRIYQSYPHEISGGQKQRVMIAMAIAINPTILIADEPSTALDVTVQKSIIELLKELQRKHGISVLFITHDLGVISQIADDILVMYKGEIVEKGKKNKILAFPDHPYTKGLLKCRPSNNLKQSRLTTINDFLNNSTSEKITEVELVSVENQEAVPILEVKGVSKYYGLRKGVFGKIAKNNIAVKNVNFYVKQGEILGLVGESGCGKTTLGRTIVQLIKSTSGDIYFKGAALNNLSKKQLKDFRKKAQIIFQDPYSSLNPKKTIGDLILEPLKVHKIGKSNERKQMVLDILDKVKLERSSYNKYPHEFSGGQRQRVVIARALILNPEFIICDESVSALDVSIQAEILNLLNDLKNEFGLTYIFISHDLSVVRYMSDRIMVMKDGVLVEINEADEIYSSPASEYTKKLIDSIPELKLD
jgi:peptide/nickel transport system ATP-binding protein